MQNTLSKDCKKSNYINHFVKPGQRPLNSKIYTNISVRGTQFEILNKSLNRMLQILNKGEEVIFCGRVYYISIGGTLESPYYRLEEYENGQLVSSYGSTHFYDLKSDFIHNYMTEKLGMNWETGIPVKPRREWLY